MVKWASRKVFGQLGRILQVENHSQLLVQRLCTKRLDDFRGGEGGECFDDLRHVLGRHGGSIGTRGRSLPEASACACVFSAQHGDVGRLLPEGRPKLLFFVRESGENQH